MVLLWPSRVTVIDLPSRYSATVASSSTTSVEEREKLPFLPITESTPLIMSFRLPVTLLT